MAVVAIRPIAVDGGRQQPAKMGEHKKSVFMDRVGFTLTAYRDMK